MCLIDLTIPKLGTNQASHVEFMRRLCGLHASFADFPMHAMRKACHFKGAKHLRSIREAPFRRARLARRHPFGAPSRRANIASPSP